MDDPVRNDGYAGVGMPRSPSKPKNVEPDIQLTLWIDCRARRITCADLPVSMRPQVFSYFAAISNTPGELRPLAGLRKEMRRLGLSERMYGHSKKLPSAKGLAHEIRRALRLAGVNMPKQLIRASGEELILDLDPELITVIGRKVQRSSDVDSDEGPIDGSGALDSTTGGANEQGGAPDTREALRVVVRQELSVGRSEQVIQLGIAPTGHGPTLLIPEVFRVRLAKDRQLDVHTIDGEWHEYAPEKYPEGRVRGAVANERIRMEVHARGVTGEIVRQAVQDYVGELSGGHDS